MDMNPVPTVKDCISFEEAKIELARISGKLVDTTDDILFSMRLHSIKVLLELIDSYTVIEQMSRKAEAKCDNIQ